MTARIRVVLLVLTLVLGGGVGLAATAQAAGTSYVWTGDDPDSNAWGAPLNWAPNGVPGNGDSVAIAPPSDQQCSAHVTDVPSGVALRNLSLADTGFQGNAADPCDASLDGGSLSVSGTFTWHGGQLATALTLLAGSAGTVSPTVDAQSELSADLTVNSVLTLDGNVRTGTADRSLGIDHPSVLAVASGGTLITQDTNDVEGSSCCVDPARLVDDGTVDDKDTLVLDNLAFDQNGTLNAENADSEVVSFGPDTAASGAQYVGTGSFRVTEADASDTLTGTQTLGPGFRFLLGGNADVSDVPADGNESLHGSFTFAGSGQFRWLGGYVAANVTIAHTVTVAVPGDVAGDPRTLDGTDDPVDGSTAVAATMTNHGVLTTNAGSTVGSSDPARLVNASDGTLNLAPRTTFDNGTGTIVNQGGKVVVLSGSAPVTLGFAYRSTAGTTTIPAGGTIRLTASPASLLASTTLTGGGRLSVDATTLNLSRTVTFTGGTVLDVLPGARVEDVVAPTPSTREAATLSGAGTLNWSGGSIAGLLTVSLTAVAVTGSVDHTVAEESDTSAHPSALTISSPVTFGPGTSDDNPNRLVIQDAGGALELTGTSTWAAHDQVVGGGLLTNSGTMTVAPGSGQRVYVTGGASFANAGTLDVTTGTFALDNDYRQSAGATGIAAGAIVREVGSTSRVRILAGTLSGLGSVYGNVLNYGSISPAGSGRGTFTIHGGYVQYRAGRATFDIAGSTQDRLTVTGKATLAGTLVIRNQYAPATGDTRALLTAPGGLTSTLGCTMTTGTGTTGASAQHWNPSIGTTTLSVVSAAGAATTC